MRVSIFIQGGPNVKHGQHASDDEVHCPESEVLAGTDPAGIHRYGYYDRLGRYEQYFLPPSSAENPIFGIKHQRVDFPILEESVRVEGFRVGVDFWITANRPDVLDHSGSCGDEVSSIDIVLHDSVWDSDGEGRIPSENFLHQCIDVRQIVFIREIGEVSFVDDSIQFLLCFPHRFRIENHC